MMNLFESLYFHLLPEEHEEEYQEIEDLTNQSGLVVFLGLLFVVFIQHGLIVNLIVIQNAGGRIHQDI